MMRPPQTKHWTWTEGNVNMLGPELDEKRLPREESEALRYSCGNIRISGDSSPACALALCFPGIVEAGELLFSM